MSAENETIKQAWHSCLEGLPEQLAAVTSPASLTVVSAGAGTGKTQTLSQRFAWLLAADPDCRADEILVLTFTEKAAQEMRDRIEKTLRKWYAAKPAELPHLKESIEFLDDACISTIHSFAMKVIRESGLALDIDPSASIIPAPREDVWWNDFSESLSSLACGQLKRLLTDEWWQRADELFAEEDFGDFVTSYTADALTQAAKEASEKLASCGRTPEELWNQTDDALLEDVSGGAEEFFKSIEETWCKLVVPALSERLAADSGSVFGAALADFESWRYEQEGAGGCDPHDFADQLLNTALAKLPGNSKLKSAAEEALAGPLKDWRDENRRLLLLHTPPSQEEARVRSLLNRTCALGWQCWDELRKAENSLSHNDLIAYANRALARTPAYSQKFKHILVDEFQDTDRLQDEMLKALRSQGGNTLFVVGDLKQSIYRFRHADLSIFQSYIKTAKECTDGSCLYVTLDRSFRTRESLLRKFNSVFGEMWKEGLEEGTEMVYEELKSPELPEPEQQKRLEERNQNGREPVLDVFIAAENRIEMKDKSGKKSKWIRAENKPEMRERLFSRLAVEIEKMHAEAMPVWDKELRPQPGFRAVKWSDFAVLVPTRTAYSDIESAFDAAGLPYVLCTSRDYFARGEVSDVISLISLLADPQDLLALAGWLSSPFSGVEAEEAASLLAEAARIGGQGQAPLYEVLGRARPDLLEKLSAMRKTASLRGAGAAILELLADQSRLACFEPEQRRRVNANISCLAALAAEYEASQGSSLAGCADYMNFAVSESRQKEEPDITDEEQDCVKVLTIHASKGLEYPVVILTGVEDGISSPSGISVSVRYGALVNKLPEYVLKDDEKEILTTAGAWYAESEKSAEGAEKERLWYVAATRARDRLLLCGLQTRGAGGELTPPDEKSFLAHVLAVSGAESGFCGLTYLEKEDTPAARRETAAAAEGQTVDLDLVTVSPASLGRLSASAYAMLCWCPTAFRIAFRQGRNLEWAVKGGEGGGGSEFGSLAHWVLARWNFRAEQLGLWLPEEGESAAHLPFELKEEFANGKKRAEIRRLLADFAASGAGNELAVLAADGELLKRETPFRVQDGDLLLVGATDLMWTQDGCLHIRDWKTTSEEAAPREYYGAQIDFYAYAAWLYCGCKTAVDASLVYLRDLSLNKKTNIYSENLFCRIKQSVHDAATIALSGAFERRKDRCASCPWIKDCMQ